MKKERQETLIDILETHRVADQQALIRRLQRRGFDATQTTVSRDLSELGVVKIGGRYRLPEIEPAGPAEPSIQVRTAGDNLIVLKTGPGQANLVAYAVDRSDFAEIVGTVAGDDTIFVAVAGPDQQRKAIQRIMRLFS